MKNKLLLLFLLTSSICVAQNKPISGLPAANTPLSGTELVPVVQGGVTKQTTIDQINASSGVSLPVNQIAIGTGTGLSSTSSFIYNPAFNFIRETDYVGHTQFSIYGLSDVPVGHYTSDTLGDPQHTGHGTFFALADQNSTYTFNDSTFSIGGVVINFPITQGAANSILTNDGSGNLRWAASGSGGVTSVGVTMPGGFSVGSPVTTMGNIAINYTAGNGIVQYTSGTFSPVTIGSGLSFNSGTLSATTTSGTWVNNQISYGNNAGTADTSNSNFTIERSGSIAYGIFFRDNSTGNNIFIDGGNTTLTPIDANYNVGIGIASLANITTEGADVAIGYHALTASTTGGVNLAIGYNALLSNITGSYNTAVGGNTLVANTNGSYNTCIGANSNVAGTSYNNSIAMGFNALITASNQFIIGNFSSGNTVSQWGINGVLYNMPSASGSTGQVLTSDGSTPANLSWATIIPSQSGNSGEYLTTNGTSTSWASPSGSGTVTSITASSPLTGGTITSSGTIGLGTVPISYGGTGQTSSTAALNALLPSQSSHGGQFLTTNGSGTVSWGTASGSSVQIARVTISSGDMATGNSVPIQLIAAPAAGQLINVLSINESYTFGTTPYTAAGGFNYYISGGSLLFSDNSLWNLSSSQINYLSPSNLASNGTQTLSASPFMFQSNADDSSGDGTFDIYVTYTIITL